MKRLIGNINLHLIGKLWILLLLVLSSACTLNVSIFDSKKSRATSSSQNGNAGGGSGGGSPSFPVSGTIIKKVDASSAGGDPKNYFDAGGFMLMSAFTKETGFELFRSDGTNAGTSLIKDLNPGIGSSSPHKFFKAGGFTYFVATTQSDGVQFWRTDGTEAGTIRLTSSTGSGAYFSSTQVNAFVAHSGSVFFMLYDDQNIIQLYYSDGTLPGTVQLTTFSNSSENVLKILNVCNGKLIFVARTAAEGDEFWVSDGTVGGTGILKDINPGAGSSFSYSDYDWALTDNGNKIIFSARDATHGFEVWTSDGTPAGTVLLADLVVGISASNPGSFYSFGSRAFFVADRKLFVSDGTTFLNLATIMPNFGVVEQYLAYKGKFFIIARDFTLGSQIWESSGAVGTTFNRSLVSNAIPIDFTPLMFGAGNHIVFPKYTAATGWELASLDLTTGSVVSLGDLNPGPNSFYDTISYEKSYSGPMLPDERVFFIGDSGGSGRELWITDGTPGGTNQVKDIFTGSQNSAFLGVKFEGTIYSGQFYFTATDGQNGLELWKSDGTSLGTSLMRRFEPRPVGINFGESLKVGNTLYFSANDSIHGWELWKTDGTEGGTLMVKDILQGSDGSGPNQLVEFDSKPFFLADGNGRDSIWKTDGTSSGTEIAIKTFPDPADSASYVMELIASAGRLFFLANNAAEGFELWRTLGDDASITQVTNIRPGPNDSFDWSIIYAKIGPYIVFDDNSNLGEPHVTDGTLAGTQILKDIIPGNSDSYPYNFRSTSTHIYFTAWNASYEENLFVTDGTPLGTRVVTGFGPDEIGNFFSSFGEFLFFTVRTPSDGLEMWYTNSDVAIRMADLNPGVEDSEYIEAAALGHNIYFFVKMNTNYFLYKFDTVSLDVVMVKDLGVQMPQHLHAHGNHLYFAYDDLIHGQELWISDGTTIGTSLFMDIQTGLNSSFPTSFTSLGSQLIFLASTLDDGQQLYSVTE